MFGMLDYRAYKLYLILFGIPNWILVMVSLFGLPLLYIELGKIWADSAFMIVIASIVSAFIVEIIWSILMTGLLKLYLFIFQLFVDIIPAEKRSKEEALQVATGGPNVAFLIKFNKKEPKEWTDKDIEFLTKGFFNFFFRDEIVHRINKIKTHYIENPDEPPNEWNTKAFLKKNKLEMPLVEKVVTNPFLRACVIRYGFFIILLMKLF